MHADRTVRLVPAPRRDTDAGNLQYHNAPMVDVRPLCLGVVPHATMPRSGAACHYASKWPDTFREPERRTERK